MTADNDISLMVNDTKGGGKINFYNGGGLDAYSSCFEYRTDNGIGMMLKSKPLYSRTYSASPNLFITSNGYIGRTTSAKKYKDNIVYIDDVRNAKKILDIQPAEWSDKKEEASEEVTNEKRYVGFIAEDFEAKGFDKVVTYSEEGEIEGLMYDRISVYHHQLIRDLYVKINELNKEIKELKGENNE